MQEAQDKYNKLSRTELEQLFLRETELSIAEKNPDVLVSCARALQRYEPYATDARNAELRTPLEELLSEYERRNQQGSRKVSRTVIAVAIAAAIATATAAALEYNTVEMLWNAISSPENAVSDTSGNVLSWTEGTRFYNSFAELLEAESLDILVPAELPNNYLFTHFEVSTFGGQIVVMAYSPEPYIDFNVKIDVDHPVEPLFQIGEIKYNIIETNGHFQAVWNYNGDYYTITAGDESVLSEVIQNLSED